MFIIFIAHVPNSSWPLWIPARFGFSDATEIFVFCSGMASALAFGRIFVARGWWVGAARTLFRAWQIYWVHIGLVLALAATLAGLDASGRFGDYHLSSLNLNPLFNDTRANLVGLMTLTYVPNYFDILPMYFGILLLLPLVMLARKAGAWAAFAFMGALWLGAQLDILSLPAEPWTDREWFFNPFGWQLVFFTGFAFMAGWIKPPPVTRGLIAAAIAILVISLPFSYFRIIDASAFFKAASIELIPLSDKTDFGLLRYIHFLALAYLAWVAAGPGGSRLRPNGMWAQRVVGVIHKVGQQALATFVVGIYLARLVPVFYETFGRSEMVIAAYNIFGFAMMILTAYIAGWFRAEKTVKPKAAARGVGGSSTGHAEPIGKRIPETVA